MGNSAVCGTNCSNLTSIGNESTWCKNGVLYEYQYADCECKNCGKKMRGERYRSLFTKNPSDFKRYIVDSHKCTHDYPFLKINENTIEYKSVGGVENRSNGFSLMALSLFWSADRYVRTTAECQVCCQKGIVVRADYQKVIENRVEYTHIKLPWCKCVKKSKSSQGQQTSTTLIDLSPVPDLSNSPSRNVEIDGHYRQFADPAHIKYVK